MGENMFIEKRKHQKKIDIKRMNREEERISKKIIKNICYNCGRPLHNCICEQE